MGFIEADTGMGRGEEGTATRTECPLFPQVSLDFVRGGEYALERMGVSYPARAHLKSPFDPDNKRVKGEY